MTSSNCPQNKESCFNQSKLLENPVLRGELANLLSHHPPADSLRGLRLLVLDHQLRQLLVGENSSKVEQLVDHLGSAIQLAADIDWEQCTQSVRE